MEKQQIESKLRDIITKRMPALTPESITPNAPLGTLGIDSLAMGWIMADIEETFEIAIRGADAMQFQTLADAVDYLAKKI